MPAVAAQQSSLFCFESPHGEVAIATALRPLPEPIFALRSRSRAAASAAAFAAALSLGRAEDLLDPSKGAGVSPPPAPAAIIASAIAAGGDAKAAAQLGEIMARADWIEPNIDSNKKTYFFS
nr:hypothetical protein Itr_chr04CG21880 [Ipomoea trifida]GMC80385.1 hypothetical protein Iba_chr04aCG19730 [Ipomoea batatas]GMC82807.1 hypothetical protein Iba_chr04bCG16850 [Ipomoea batatas]GMC84830.1 hypothetical protein Iba_chr04cCG15380 [Ipomoea batatas]GMC86919.1 hypothetical protein Iba_chr04dCG15350 [Ipomoea batatas]